MHRLHQLFLPDDPRLSMREGDNVGKVDLLPSKIGRLDTISLAFTQMSGREVVEVPISAYPLDGQGWVAGIGLHAATCHQSIPACFPGRVIGHRCGEANRLTCFWPEGKKKSWAEMPDYTMPRVGSTRRPCPQVSDKGGKVGWWSDGVKWVSEACVPRLLLYRLA